MFKIGQKVVCIDPPANGCIKYGEVYTIKEHGYNFGRYWVTLYEADPTPPHDSFFAWRFRPVDDSWAEGLLAKIESEVKHEQLILA